MQYGLACMAMQGQVTTGQRRTKSSVIGLRILPQRFARPSCPKELQIDASVTKSDPKAIKRQRSYAAPAHLITDLMDGMTEGVFLPLARATQLNQDPAVREQLALAHEYLSGQASYQLGLAVR